MVKYQQDGLLGIPTERAGAYERAVRAGGAVLSFRVPTAEEAARARLHLLQHGAREVEDFQPAL